MGMTINAPDMASARALIDPGNVLALVVSEAFKAEAFRKKLEGLGLAPCDKPETRNNS